MKSNELAVRANSYLEAGNVKAAILTIVSAVEEQEKFNAEIRKCVVQNTRQLTDIEEEYPLLPPEAEDLSNAVKRKGTWELGGKKSNAYKDSGLRRKVFMDIYLQLKREFGLIDEFGMQVSYKKLKRKHFRAALACVEEYVLPRDLENTIQALNELED